MLRYLKCILASCPALAQQTMIRPRFCGPKVLVYKAHNHEAPSRKEIKKQMFYYVMKRKMQSDKTLDFRSVYEEVCLK